MQIKHNIRFIAHFKKRDQFLASVLLKAKKNNQTYKLTTVIKSKQIKKNKKLTVVGVSSIPLPRLKKSTFEICEF